MHFPTDSFCKSITMGKPDRISSIWRDNYHRPSSINISKSSTVRFSWFISNFILCTVLVAGCWYEGFRCIVSINKVCVVCIKPQKECPIAGWIIGRSTRAAFDIHLAQYPSQKIMLILWHPPCSHNKEKISCFCICRVTAGKRGALRRTVDGGCFHFRCGW